MRGCLAIGLATAQVVLTISRMRVLTRTSLQNGNNQLQKSDQSTALKREQANALFGCGGVEASKLLQFDSKTQSLHESAETGRVGFFQAIDEVRLNNLASKESERRNTRSLWSRRFGQDQRLVLEAHRGLAAPGSQAHHKQGRRSTLTGTPPQWGCIRGPFGEGGSKPSKVKGRRGEKFNEHFRALSGLHNASNNQMLKQSCNQLPDAITRSRIFCDHLSQCAMVVGVLQGLRNARERAMYSNTVPWPMHLGQWPHSLRTHFI